MMRVVVVMLVLMNMVVMMPMSVDRNRVVRAVILFLIGHCRFRLDLCLPSVVDGRAGPSWDVKALMCTLRTVSTAIEGDKGVLGERCLADGALLDRGTLDLQPPVDAWPAVEVTTEGYDGIDRKVQADVAVEAPAR